MKKTILLLSLTFLCGNGLASVKLPTTTVYVPLDGNDTNTGSAAAPVATVAAALTRMDAQSGPGVIVLSGGTHSVRSPILVGLQPAGLAPGRTLTLTAAPGETPILDGSIAVAPTPLAGWPGVYLVPAVLASSGLPSVWQETGQIRYVPAADLNALQTTDCSCYPYASNRLAIHPAGGVLPAAGDLRMSVAAAGLKILRNNVRVSAWSFRGFTHEYESAAIVLGNASGPNAITNVVLDSITAANCYVGVKVNYGVDAVQVVNSTIRNTIAGIYQMSGTLTVTNCFIGTVSQQHPFAFRGRHFGNCKDDYVL